MFSKPLAFLLLALGCLTAAAGGAYVATRHNATPPVVSTAPAPMEANPVAPPSAQPVAETESPVTAEKPAPAPDKTLKAEAPVPAPRHAGAPTPKSPTSAPASRTARRDGQPAPRTIPMSGVPAGAPQSDPQTAPGQPLPDAAPAPSGSKPIDTRPIEPQPEAPRVPQFDEVILPASSVIGLQLETSLSSDRARIEDRVDARVSRDVMAAGRVAIPAGSRVIGSVIEIDKGGKVKAAARIGIRFHTLVLADGSEVTLRTDPIIREGESPAGNSAKKIGGATIAGAILGGILGGGKGAAIGAATGAGGGTASVMTGDRSSVNIPAGSFMNTKLASPATVTVERRE